MLEGSFADQIDQSIWSNSKLNQGKLLGTMSSQVLNITRGGDLTMFLGNQFQCLSDLPKNKVFYYVCIVFPYLNLCPLPLVI